MVVTDARPAILGAESLHHSLCAQGYKDELLLRPLGQKLELMSLTRLCDRYLVNMIDLVGVTFGIARDHGLSFYVA
jgi:hypothetical protein